jgi:hypothetical protein
LIAPDNECVVPGGTNTDIGNQKRGSKKRKNSSHDITSFKAANSHYKKSPVMHYITMRARALVAAGI